MTFNDEGSLCFFKFDERAKIPSKRLEDGGYDIYALFNEDIVIVKPHETIMLPTGLGSVFSDRFVIVLHERGSTGTKGIAQRSGVIDSGYRGEWQVPITNTTDDVLCFVKTTGTDDELNNRVNELEDLFGIDYRVYPQEKAICQALLLEVPKVIIKEITQKEAVKYVSERLDGKLGSSKK